MKERLQALKILLQVIEDKTSLMHTLKAPNVSAFTKALCFGVCRHYYRLEMIADCLVKKRPDTEAIWMIILMGLYQLHYSTKPDYAAVKETVALADKIKKSWAKGLVNAVLRSFLREQAAIIERLSQQADFIYGHPAWFVQRLQQDWPEQWQSILAANDVHPPMSLRVNQQRTTRDDYLQRLAAANIQAYPHVYSSVGIMLQQPCSVDDLPLFSEGYVSVQDQAAQLAIPLLNLQPGLRVLDACCAPGGKTSHILEAEPLLQECVAIDISDDRITRVKENLQRLDLKATLLQGDAAEPTTWWDGHLFDRILLDAPCSATGVIRRHPDIKLLRQPEEIATINALQRRLLAQLWPLLKPAGLLVYATCSVLKQENQAVIDDFFKKHDDVKCIHTQVILPGDENSDGFFYCVLQRILDFGQTAI